MTKARYPCFFHSNQNVWLHHCSNLSLSVKYILNRYHW